MTFLTLETIKAHSRIVGTLEDSVLTIYANAAEATVLNVCNTTYEALIQKYETVPAPLVQAALMLVDTAYTYRAPINPTNLYLVPYTFDMLVKPYMILTYPKAEEEETTEEEEEES